MSTPASPAQRYAAFRQRSEDGAELAAFQGLYDFAFDDFQRRACQALAGGHGVLVAAPTGSGKTVIGEFAVHLALAEGRKCFYTTPIKALSNQKYNDLVRRYGAGQVGLLTGDNSINGEAPVVVMTTEVLRNMIYAQSPTLEGLRYVILDEVHYLQNRYRGAVWEEVIIHLPLTVQLVCLSATVSNATELTEWITTVRSANLPHLHSFCNGLELDRAAVNAGLTLPHHNGRTEGVNTRTKRIMRQMHGRAGFDLLHHRILLP